MDTLFLRITKPESARLSQQELRLQQYAVELRNRWAAEQVDLRRLQRLWEMKRTAINAHIAEFHVEIQRLEQQLNAPSYV